MYPHRIRLRGPWEYAAGSLLGRVSLPVALADTKLSSHIGSIRFTRRFGYPGRIDPGERVLLVVESPAASVSLTLNGLALGESSVTEEWDITDRLSERNELVIVTPGGAGVPWSEVAMEVRRTAYLRSVRAWVEGDTIHATGTVAGKADGPLDLYLLAGRGTVAYTSIAATEEGTPFQLQGPGEPTASVRLELVQGAIVWYTTLVPATQGSAD